jgi:hypothetical protein
MVMNLAGLGPKNDFASEAQVVIMSYRPILPLERVACVNKPATVRQ